MVPILQGIFPILTGLARKSRVSESHFSTNQFVMAPIKFGYSANASKKHRATVTTELKRLNAKNLQRTTEREQFISLHEPSWLHFPVARTKVQFVHHCTLKSSVPEKIFLGIAGASTVMFSPTNCQNCSFFGKRSWIRLCISRLLSLLQLDIWTYASTDTRHKLTPGNPGKQPETFPSLQRSTMNIKRTVIARRLDLFITSRKRGSWRFSSKIAIRVLPRYT